VRVAATPAEGLVLASRHAELPLSVLFHRFAFRRRSSGVVARRVRGAADIRSCSRSVSATRRSSDATGRSAVGHCSDDGAELGTRYFTRAFICAGEFRHRRRTATWSR
jgi:hypothetical protein